MSTESGPQRVKQLTEWGPQRVKQLTDGLVDGVVVVVGDEGEPLQLAGRLVGDEVHLLDVAELGEHLPHLLVRRVVLQTPHEHLLHRLLRTGTARLLQRKRVSIVNVKEGNVSCNEALNTIYLRLYGVRHMVKDHTDSVNLNGY